jgi:hypothetical protein
MRIGISGETTLDIQPGIRLSIRDGVIVITADVDQAAEQPTPAVVEAPEFPRLHFTEEAEVTTTEREPEHVVAAGGVWQKRSRPRDDETPAPPTPPEAPRSSALPLPSRDIEERENKVLEALLHSEDPYAWQEFGQVMKLAFPDEPHRDEKKMPTYFYSLNRHVIDRLVKRQELDLQKSYPFGPGKKSRFQYRLHQPQPEGKSDVAAVSSQARYEGKDAHA